MCHWFIALFQATSTVEVDMERAEKLQVTRADFMGSLNNDIKPVCDTLGSCCVKSLWSNDVKNGQHGVSHHPECFVYRLLAQIRRITPATS